MIAAGPAHPESDDADARSDAAGGAAADAPRAEARRRLARECLGNATYRVADEPPPSDACLVVQLDPALAARLEGECAADETPDEAAARLLTELLHAMPPAAPAPAASPVRRKPRRTKRRA